MISARSPPSLVPGSLVLKGFQKDRPILLRYSGNPVLSVGMAVIVVVMVVRPVGVAEGHLCGVEFAVHGGGSLRKIRRMRATRQRILRRVNEPVLKIPGSFPASPGLRDEITRFLQL